MSVCCPECGSPWTTAIRGHRGDASPGEWCDYLCLEPSCDGWLFVAVMPEPPDDYAGDGVFADNH